MNISLKTPFISLVFLFLIGCDSVQSVQKENPLVNALIKNGIDISNDIDMNPDFSTGWVASKSGVRKVENYNSSSEIWHPAYFPNLDGSPYLSVAVDTFDNNIVFVGNQRVYRTTNGGTISGSDDGWDQVFTPEVGPYNFNRINTISTVKKLYYFILIISNIFLLVIILFY